MASYRIAIKASAAKEPERLPKQIISRVLTAVEGLAETPYPAGSRKFLGFEHTYRIRVGDYRVLYSVYENQLLIEVIRIRHRKDAYR